MKFKGASNHGLYNGVYFERYKLYKLFDLFLSAVEPVVGACVVIAKYRMYASCRGLVLYYMEDTW